ncbi:N-acetylmuramoyl-L-alanine amidase [Zhengella mangrovi]|uniref:N-acetylmuramoyl-L-alanine amidase n=1 Tax=Zhengella mangrovi TaxID=1982044 RepID=A0A2G1QQ28_9HYPH|nr:N-acetylmuramoyl-L-alanine amidase [Zhengella mangrovi]PHP67602.1 N-acetylmuramoyl-L-alanine amidase [Zhengella mangrovi]
MTGFRPDHAGADVRTSPNFGPRRDNKAPTILLLHYTGMETGEAAESWLCDPASNVSCHYIVHEDGRIVQMVREADRAWHAGAAYWAGETDINSASIGIEIVNPGHAGELPEFPQAQIDAVIDLSRGIVQRHGIHPENVLAHSDVAPGRKCDPGEKFPWSRLADAGLCIYVEPAAIDKGDLLQAGAKGEAVEKLQSMLALVGYGVDISGNFDERTRDCVTAFQRRYRARKVDGIADPSTVKTLEALLDRLPDAFS